MKGAGRNAEIIAEAMEYIQKGFDLLNQVERTAEPISEVMPAQIGPWTCGEDLAYSMVEDAQADLDGVLVHLDAGRGLFAGKRVFSREAEKYLDDLHVKYDDEDLDLDEYSEYDPLVFPGDVPEEDMKIIRALAELERDGLLETMRTTGKFVTQDQERISEIRSTLAADSIRILIGNLKSLGLTEDQILAALEQSLKEEKKTDGTINREDIG